MLASSEKEDTALLIVAITQGAIKQASKQAIEQSINRSIE
jgi:hypothetical protein